LKTTILLVFVALSLQACLFGKKDDPTTCRANEECASKVCNLATYYCEPVGGGLDSGAGGTGAGGAIADGPGVVDIGGNFPLDAAAGAGGTGGGGTVADASSDSAVPDGSDAALDRPFPDAAADVTSPDAPGTCSVDQECGGSLPLCFNRVCARCATEPQPVIPQAACVWLAWVPNTVSELRQPVIRAPTLVSSAPLPPTAAVPSRSVAAASVRRVGQMETAQV
jgi:hypothetical protein